MFTTPAFAQGAPVGFLDPASPIWMILMLILVMYFFFLRPQQKRAKEHQDMVKNLRRGDTIVTSGGLVGKVTKLVDDEQVEFEIADGVRVRQVRSMVTTVRAKGEPRDEAAAS
jgi:preprotein translocase subunit YajC